MSFSEERLLILKMLEEGKITGEEAAKLLEALGESSNNHEAEKNSRNKQSAFQDEVQKLRDRLHEWKKDLKNNFNQKDFDHTVDDFAAKAEKLGKNVAATTFSFVDRIIDFVGSYVDTNSFNFFGSMPTVEKSFEAPAIEGSEIIINGINGHIILKKHIDNRILIKSRIRSRLNNPEEVLTFDNIAGNVSVRMNQTGNVSVSHEIFLPAVKFKKISLQTSNGKIYIEDSISEEFESITRNGNIELMGVNSSKISAATKNSKIMIGYVTGKQLDISTQNSIIDIKHLKAERINATTGNGRIAVENILNAEGSDQITMNLKTSNGAIKVNMNDMDNRGYKVRAKTSNGNINLLIPEITYHNLNKQGPVGTFIEAESIGYHEYAQKVSINAETQNGQIEIIK